MYKFLIVFLISYNVMSQNVSVRDKRLSANLKAADSLYIMQKAPLENIGRTFAKSFIDRKWKDLESQISALSIDSLSISTLDSLGYASEIDPNYFKYDPFLYEFHRKSNFTSFFSSLINMYLPNRKNSIDFPKLKIIKVNTNFDNVSSINPTLGKASYYNSLLYGGVEIVLTDDKNDLNIVIGEMLFTGKKWIMTKRIGVSSSPKN
jgi:hypothetical protein